MTPDDDATPPPDKPKRDRVSSKKRDAPPGNGRTKDKPKGPKKAAKGKPNPRVAKTDQRRRGNLNLGAPTRLTDEVAGRVIEALTRHVSRNGAFHGAGVSADTGNRWLGWGARYDDGIGPNGTGPRDRTHKTYSDFRRRVLQAEADSERVLLSIVEKAATGELRRTDSDGVEHPIEPDWKAGLEVLRRRHRQQWADKVEIHATHEHAEPEADRVADAVLRDPTLAAELTAALGKITVQLSQPKGRGSDKKESATS